MKFLKIGNVVLNPTAIASVDLFQQRRTGVHHVVTLLSIVSCINSDSSSDSETRSFAADSPEGKALEQYFSSPDNVLKISGVTDEEEQFYWYRSVGGKLDYYNWLGRFHKYQQLMEIENPNDSQMKIIQSLESELLY